MKLIYKNIAETPLACLQRNFKNDSIKRTYAGRLDPMAEGELLILEGDEIKQKQKYLDLDKIYDYKLCTGITTDSYDVLGRILNVNINANHTRTPTLEKNRIIHKYPIFSSKTLNGKALFYLYKNGNLKLSDLPTYIGTIQSHKIIKKYTLTGEEIALTAIKNIKQVSGDFRQKEIIEDWKDFKQKYAEEIFIIFDITATVSSGVYIRNLANNQQGIVLRIVRKKILL